MNRYLKVVFLPHFVLHQAIIKVAKWPATYPAGIWACRFFSLTKLTGWELLKGNSWCMLHPFSTTWRADNSWPSKWLATRISFSPSDLYELIRLKIQSHHDQLFKEQLPFDRVFGLKESAYWYHLHTGSEVQKSGSSTCFFGSISHFSEGFIIIYITGGLLE